jgi:hypothetical protein
MDSRSQRSRKPLFKDEAASSRSYAKKRVDDDESDEYDTGRSQRRSQRPASTNEGEENVNNRWSDQVQRRTQRLYDEYDNEKEDEDDEDYSKKETKRFNLKHNQDEIMEDDIEFEEDEEDDNNEELEITKTSRINKYGEESERKSAISQRILLYSVKREQSNY